jgi:hypothetical protein
MNGLILFGTSVAFSFAAWIYLGIRYAWPALAGREFAASARPILLMHTFRFIGLAFLVPGVVSRSLQPGFALPAAYGDLAATVLAWLAIAALGTRLERAAAWALGIWGTLDLLLAFYLGLFGVRIAPSALGAAFFIPTVLVPMLFVSHGLLFALLLRNGPRTT